MAAAGVHVAYWESEKRPHAGPGACAVHVAWMCGWAVAWIVLGVGVRNYPSWEPRSRAAREGRRDPP